MKKCILCIVAILLVSLLMACGKTNTADELEKTNLPNVNSEDSTNTANKTTTEEYPKEVKFVLDRDIFVLKNDFPELYKGAINDIDLIVAYKENWKFCNVLNEKNFKQIDWNVTSPMDGAKIVTFTGIPRITEIDTIAAIEFYVQEGAKIPLAWSMTTKNSKGTSEVTVQSYLDQGLDFDTALVSADATISSMVAFMAEDATGTSEQYETKTDAGIDNSNKNNKSKSNVSHAHSYGTWQDNKDNSTHSRTCSCGEKESGSHTFDYGIVTKQATETATGVRTYTCTKCRAKKTESIAKLVHNHEYKGVWKDDKNDYTHSKVCSCGNQINEEHDFKYGTVTKTPTITSTGIKTYSCMECGAKKTETLPKVEHTHSYGSWKNDNNDSTHSRTCSCGAKEKEEHIFDSGKVTKEPTTTSTGNKTYTCIECGAITWKTLPKLETPQVSEPEVSEKNESYSSETIDYDYQCICNYCGYDDGIKHLELERGVEEDVIWNCSSCGKENWNYMTLN